MAWKSFGAVAVLCIVLAFTGGGCAGGGASSPGSSSPGSSVGSSGDAQSGGSVAGVAKLAWDAPVTNADGTPLTGLAGYKVYYGTSSGTYATAIDVGPATTYSLDKLGPGTYFIVVTAYAGSGVESAYSNEVSKTIL